MSAAIALVTGANKGIGFETARQLAAKGMTVLLGARDCKSGQEAVAALNAQGHDVRFVELDVTNPAHHHRLREKIETEFGVLDVLVNNAGIAPEAGLSPSTVSLETLRSVFETNLFSVIALTQELLPLIKKSTHGRIVNLSSRLGSVSLNASAPADGWYEELGYNTSKAAVNMFTILLARELRGSAIKVNSAHPGWVQTAMGGQNAPLSPSEGAHTSVWLATLPDDGPTGGFFHKQDALPW